MRKIERSDVKDIIEYEQAREEFRRDIIELKKSRRVTVGSSLTFVFENRDTVLFQIEEMMRAERIVQEQQIVAELDVYNALIPDDWELSATLLIEITDQGQIQPMLDKLLGLDGPGRHVSIRFGPECVYADFEGGRSNGEKISAVHFLRFPFNERQLRRFRAGEDVGYLYVDHPGYKKHTRITPNVRANLAQDLGR